MGSTVALLLVALVQPLADPLLDRLAGSWSGSGTVLGAPATVRLVWDWTLDRRFLRLTFENQMGPGKRFDGHAYYRPLGGGAYRGMWFDSSGMMRPIDGAAKGDALVALWGTADTERGETTYHLRPDGALEIVDRVMSKDGRWREFGRVVVSRRP